MALRVVGAGLGRTGTASLKVALEQLLGGRCYHMLEVFERDDAPAWDAAIDGDVDWDSLLGDYSASVDWPASAFWRELLAENPEALILLSERDSPQAWWASMERTIVPTLQRPVPPDEPALVRQRAMIATLLRRRFTPEWDDAAASMAAYERHNADVRDGAPARQLLQWRPGDGWEPICAALQLPVPSAPFPRENTTADFRARQGLDEG
jgi:hypothetical protein